ncbi:MAG: hypothetical protein U0905_22405 [Pirellulales bacterium]
MNQHQHDRSIKTDCESISVSCICRRLRRKLAITGFVFSFFWSAAAALYLTLRHEVDHTDMDEIDLFEKQPAKSIPSIGSPPSPENNPALSGVHEQAE